VDLVHHQSGHIGHGELVNKGDPELGRPCGVGQIHQRIADACSQTANTGAKEQSGQNAHGVAHRQRRLSKRAGNGDADELGQHKDHGGQNAYQRDVADRKDGLFLHGDSPSGMSRGLDGG